MERLPQGFAPLYYFIVFCCSGTPVGHRNLFGDSPQMKNPLDANQMTENEISHDDVDDDSE